MKDNKQLINNLIGQLEGIKRMLEDDRECSDILIQLKAVKSGLNSVANRIIEETTLDCLSDDTKINKEKVQKLLKELVNGN